MRMQTEMLPSCSVHFADCLCVMDLVVGTRAMHRLLVCKCMSFRAQIPSLVHLQCTPASPTRSRYFMAWARQQHEITQNRPCLQRLMCTSSHACTYVEYAGNWLPARRRCDHGCRLLWPRHKGTQNARTQWGSRSTEGCQALAVACSGIQGRLQPLCKMQATIDIVCLSLEACMHASCGA
jgi:hypothetical protein